MNIDAVSKKFDITKDTLRYWERIGLLPKVQRNENGYRNYCENDMNWISYIISMRKTGMPIETCIEYVRMLHKKDVSPEARRKLLINQRDELVAQIQNIQLVIDYLNEKIDHFEEHILPKEAEQLFLDKR
ncbi:MerR family transcriptional regulator [Listeria sp. PSOL-1]|uniref:MerR family transcriptional regulator n=1 Tax=Listeria sp. PSOL-1 TaxID=1844999 RepID=UPI0013D006CE|nr:MerR family transcriptional regulator [Listeria sp. PSOL-1]